MTANYNSVSILLVDDDDVDRTAVLRAFRSMKIANDIIEAHDGLEALSILRGTDPSRKISRPFLVLLDLSMPRMDGLEFLAELRQDNLLESSIVFVLTTSSADEDRTAAYRQHVAGYIVKADFANQFWRVVEMIDHFWRIIEFP